MGGSLALPFWLRTFQLTMFGRTGDFYTTFLMSGFGFILGLTLVLTSGFNDHDLASSAHIGLISILVLVNVAFMRFVLSLGSGLRFTVLHYRLQLPYDFYTLGSAVSSRALIDQSMS